MSRRLLIVGFVFCAASLLIPPLGVGGLVIGIIAIVRGRVGPGTTLVVLAVILPLAGAVILQSFFARPYRIPSAAMLPTLEVGDRIVVDPGGEKPQVGDIVVFHPPAGAEREPQCAVRPKPRQACPKPTRRTADVTFVKRVVAGPGDRLAVVDGHVVRNGRRQREPFIEPCGGGPECNLTRVITVPPDHYFMMGDNRGASDDSRFWGPVPGDAIVGPAFFRYWPGGRVGGL